RLLTPRYLVQPPLEVTTLDVGANELEGQPVCHLGFSLAPEAPEKVGPRRGQQVVAAERTRRGESIDELESGLSAVGHGNRDRTVELHDRRRRHPRELSIQQRDLVPIGRARLAGTPVACGDRSLHLVRTGLATSQRGIEQFEPG